MATADNSKCKQCGIAAPEPDYPTPLCTPCRLKLVRRPIPAWITISFVAVLAAFLYSCVSFPRSLRTGIAFERAQRAETAGKYADAVKEYDVVLRAFPDSADTLGRVALAAYHAGDTDRARSALDQLNGRTLRSESLAEQLQSLHDSLNQQPAAPPGQGGQ